MHEFGIYKGGIMPCVATTGSPSDYLFDLPVRWPSALLWRSGCLDSRGMYLTTNGVGPGQTRWPNVEMNIDLDEAGADAAITLSDPPPVLSWDCSLSLRRGIYFLARSSMLIGTRSSEYLGDCIGVKVTSATIETDGSDNIGASLFTPIIGADLISTAGGLGSVMCRGVHTDLLIKPRAFGIVDASARSSSDFIPMSSSLYWNDLVSNSIQPTFGSDLLSADYRNPEVPINQRVTVSSHDAYAYVGLAGIFADERPSDTW